MDQVFKPEIKDRWNMETIVDKEREIPVAFNVDVVVAGGGPAGVGAAIAAAREGAETLLVERYGHLGDRSIDRLQYTVLVLRFFQKNQHVSL